MAKFARNVSALWKQGWNEIPEVMFASGFGLFGLVGCMVALYHYEQNENKTHRYKRFYTIMRPDDPRVDWLKRADDSPVFTSTRNASRF